ncbi:MAG: hypothetical protein JRI23_29865 [Deltaproteobacteria bacterium]|jgi:hypothetical protein|nr:hypothetical protein [Deltaproteobacteria bacterium]MBW2536358.1 hypothetical protein [Deltaproteobacteria bacterium]
MYRDELAAYRERLETARDDAARAWQDVEGELDAMRALNDQLERRKLRGLEPPEIEPLRAFELPGEGASSREYIELSGQVEREVERLRGEAELLRKVNLVLNARAQGKRADLPLAPPPRSVPFSYLLGQWLGVSPMALLLSVILGSVGMFFVGGLVAAAGAGDRWTLLPAFVAGTLLALLFVLARAKMHFLGACEQAEGVTVSSSNSTGSSYKNWNLPVARGWEVTYEPYTGSGTKTSLQFLTADGRTGAATVKGRPYESGVVLYHPVTMRAHCVSDFRCAPRPNARGQWQPGLSISVIIRACITGLVLGLWLLSPLIAMLVS